MQGQWQGHWAGDWQGQTEGGPPVVLAALSVSGAGSAVMTATVLGRAPVASTALGGAGGWFAPRKRRKTRLDELLEQWASEPLRKQKEDDEARQLAEHVAKLQAAIESAQRAQDRARKRADAASGERDALASKVLMARAVDKQQRAEAEYTAAVQAESVARRQLKETDIAFVMAVLMDA